MMKVFIFATTFLINAHISAGLYGLLAGVGEE